MSKIQLLLVAFLLMASTASAQKREKFEFMRNLPVYADSLIAHFDYPLAWENSGFKKFSKWKKLARQKVFDCMLMPPPPPADGYQPSIRYHAGWYYIYWGDPDFGVYMVKTQNPAGGVPTGFQLAMRSRSPYGPYEHKIVLAQGKTTINGPHHGGWVHTKYGEDWFLHFQDKEAYGRVVHLNPVDWSTGWPTGLG